MNKTIRPNITANHKVEALIINVDATAVSFNMPLLTRIKLRDPSVTPIPPGNIEIAPAIVENE